MGVSPFSSEAARQTVGMLHHKFVDSKPVAVDEGVMWVLCTVRWAWKTCSKLENIQLYSEPQPHFTFCQKKTKLIIYVQKKYNKTYKTVSKHWTF